MQIFINHDKNKKIAVKTRDELSSACNKYGINITDNPESADMICSIGGDGTFLESSRLSKSTPIIGINCGTLGYLTDINPEDISKVLRDIIDEKYIVEERMMLEGEIIRKNGQKTSIPPALNDIAISKNTFGVVRFDTIIDDKLINSYTADGIILCTPTGSTAYNLSCGGPISDPTAHIITLTPIAPHTLLNRSIILKDNSTIEIRIKELHNQTTCYVLYDGKPIEVSAGDTIQINKSKQITKIIKLNWQNFIENIRNKIN